MSRFRPTRREVPGLNTASLPDLIFTVLFFFMIVTHIRETQLKVEYRTPQGTELTKLTRKSATVYIYIGRPMGETGSSGGPATCIQLNDKLATVADVAEFVARERAAMSPSDARDMTVSIKADRDVPMGIIQDVTRALRAAHVQRVLFSAEESGKH